MARSRLSKLTALLVPPLCAACRLGCPPEREICMQCRTLLETARMPRADGLRVAAFEYTGVARELTLALKFGGAVALADEMAELMLARVGPALADADLIVPAPAHPERLRRRGYNQAALLADALAARSGATSLDLLVRVGGRRPQSELGRRERLALAAGSIRVDSRRLRTDRPPGGRAALVQTNVVVCDDVATTGSTLEACTQAIRELLPETGASRLRAVVFAAA